MDSATNFEGQQLGRTMLASAAAQGEGWAETPARGVYTAVSQSHVMAKDHATQWLLDKQRRAQEDGRTNHCQFWEDLTDQRQFQWPYLVAGLRGGEAVLQAGVTFFGTCWLSDWNQPRILHPLERRGVRRASGHKVLGVV